ncbi:hypothetical protein [Bartonella grahamii]|uniref:hypothetical protein n=1 Tax=Bartonella grahamii TaxID=33045 RepID=UPI00047D80A9
MDSTVIFFQQKYRKSFYKISKFIASSVALGPSATAERLSSIAVGLNAQSKGDNSAAFGDLVYVLNIMLISR